MGGGGGFDKNFSGALEAAAIVRTTFNPRDEAFQVWMGLTEEISAIVPK